jgi:hypothetical protein
MKLIRGTFIVLCTLIASAQAQVLLQPGDVFTYTFTSLPQVVPGAGMSDVPTGAFGFTVSSFDAGTDMLFVEMFENGTNEAPLLTFVTEATSDGSSFPNAWSDFQGTVRFTMLSGSVTLESILFFHEVLLGPGTWERHQLAVVPTRGGADLLQQRVPCAGPVSGGAWRNHGQYVSAVTRVARDLVSQGLLTKQERRSAIRDAAHSQCGKKQRGRH